MVVIMDKTTPLPIGSMVKTRFTEKNLLSVEMREALTWSLKFLMASFFRVPVARAPQNCGDFKYV
jgi:hypothetical protein